MFVRCSAWQRRGGGGAVVQVTGGGGEGGVAMSGGMEGRGMGWYVEVRRAGGGGGAGRGSGVAGGALGRARQAARGNRVTSLMGDMVGRVHRLNVAMTWPNTWTYLK